MFRARSNIITKMEKQFFDKLFTSLAPIHFYRYKCHKKETYELSQIFRTCSEIIFGNQYPLKIETLLKLSNDFAFFNIGDGKRAQTSHVLKKLDKNFTTFSVDPLISQRYEIKGSTFPVMFENFTVPKINKIPILIFQHSHIEIYKCLKKFQHFDLVYIIDMPCCVNTAIHCCRIPDITINYTSPLFPHSPMNSRAWKLTKCEIKKWVKNSEENIHLKNSHLIYKYKLKNRVMFEKLKLQVSREKMNLWNNHKLHSAKYNAYKSKWESSKIPKRFNIFPKKLIFSIETKLPRKQFKTWFCGLSWLKVTELLPIKLFLIKKCF